MVQAEETTAMGLKIEIQAIYDGYVSMSDRFQNPRLEGAQRHLYHLCSAAGWSLDQS